MEYVSGQYNEIYSKYIGLDITSDIFIAFQGKPCAIWYVSMYVLFEVWGCYAHLPLESN
jgi:hypothetical protein